MLAKKPRTVDDDDDDDIMLPLRQRRLPSFIAIDDTPPTPKPSSDAGLYPTFISDCQTEVKLLMSTKICYVLSVIGTLWQVPENVDKNYEKGRK